MGNIQDSGLITSPFFGDLTTYLSGFNSRLGIPLVATISSLCENVSWHLPPVRSDNQLQLYSFLTTIQLSEEEDFFEWEINGKVSRVFRTGEVYDYLCESSPDVAWASLVWFPRAIPRHSFHTWLLIQDRLPTRDRLTRWGIRTDDRCLLCNTTPESRDHLFFSCNYSFELWRMVASRLRLIPQRLWQDIQQQMSSIPPPNYQRHLTLLGWRAVLYWIWNERNARLHTNTFRSTDQIFKLLDHQLRNKF